MTTIWKFPLKVADRQTVKMPLPAMVRSVQAQGDQVCLWAEVAPDLAKCDIEIIIVGTGHEIPDIESGHLRYISTFQMHSGALVFHAYEVVHRPS